MAQKGWDHSARVQTEKMEQVGIEGFHVSLDDVTIQQLDTGGIRARLMGMRGWDDTRERERYWRVKAIAV